MVTKLISIILLMMDSIAITSKTDDEDRRGYQGLRFAELKVGIVFFQLIMRGKTAQRHGQYDRDS